MSAVFFLRMILWKDVAKQVIPGCYLSWIHLIISPYWTRGKIRLQVKAAYEEIHFKEVLVPVCL